MVQINAANIFVISSTIPGYWMHVFWEREKKYYEKHGNQEDNKLKVCFVQK